MTRQEAIEVIREHGVSYIPRNTEIFTEVDAAWTVAIKALEAWDDVVAEIEDIAGDLINDTEYTAGCRDALNIVNTHLNEIEN